MNLKVKEKDIKNYDEIFDVKDYDKRAEGAQSATDKFYTLITKFYEKGWGESFHFAPRKKRESFHDSILRHEHYLANKLAINSNDKVLDVGCGVMGPARNIAKLTRADITGITINEYQIERCKELNKDTEVNHLLHPIQGDYMQMPFEDNTFDKMYAIEALCHAPSLDGVYEQIYKKLKPGGKAFFYQWGMTDKYDPNNPRHVKSKEMIEYGNSITRLKTLAEIDEKLANSKLIVEEAVDLAAHIANDDITWYSTLESGWSLSQIRHTKLSRTAVGLMLRTFEALGIFPKGISKTQKLLLVAADGLVEGGKLGIFTPMYGILVSKPK
ncbi:MAG: methyltransferase domain-containing protein [Chitinophagales bacterium]